MRVAVAQTEPQLGEKERNLEVCVARLEEAATEGAALLVLPECAIPGYMFDSAEEALPFAEGIPGPSTEILERESRRLGMHVVCGLLERDGDVMHNAAVFVGPDGLIGVYRKTHLPFLGVDRFVVAGDELPIFETPLGRVGLEICYDLRFPEVTRALALRGADLIAHPTNFPVAARLQTDSSPALGLRRTGSTCSPQIASVRSDGESSAAGARSSIRTATGSRRPGPTRRPYSSPTMTCSAPATRTT